MSELDDLMPTSPDHNAARLAELKRLFPDLFSDEGRLDVKAVRKLADPNMLDMEKFRFTWYGKSRARRKAFTPSRGALVYDAERSVNPELADGNMIIEGENLEVLKLLTSAYSEKVKCIYIDPPYNTGHDFIYPDNYTQGKKEYWEQNGIFKDGVKMDSNPDSNGRFHSDWLSMMFSRLLVARLLLKEDGVIFISIDDNEVHNLRKLMDEVFGEENFIAIFPWRKRTAKSDVPFGVSQDYEWILGYTKGEFLAGIAHKRKYYKSDDFPDDPWRLADLTKQTSASERPNSAFDMVDPKTGNIYPFNPNRVWAVTEKTFQVYYDKGKIVFPGDYDFLNISIPAYRIFESEDRAKALQKYGTEEPMKAVSTQLPTFVGMSENGNKQLVSLFGSKIFPFPKPVELLKYLLTIVNGQEDSLILDFFAGSGTLAQAVMELNVTDGGNRRFMLVQLPERVDENSDAYKAGYRKISDLTVERVKRAIAQQQTAMPLFEPNGFKVYRLAKSCFPRSTFQPDPDKSMEENVAALKQHIAEVEANMWLEFERDAVFDEVLLKHGFQLNYTLKKQDVFTQNDVFLARAAGKEMLICLDSFLHKETVDYFKTHRDPFFLCLERALNTDKKWALDHYLGKRLKTI